ncbi:MAG: hypothetical protein SNG49_02775 [Rikenellaceae bacterium]
MKRSLLSLALLCILALQSCGEASNVKTISSLDELYQVAAESDASIKMEPGTYTLADYLTEEKIAATPFADSINRKAMLLFSGSNNSFDFTGVTLEIDTKLLAAFDCSINEIQITGQGNLIKGLTVKELGNNPPSRKGARSFVVTGDNNKIDDVTLNMNGSHPYGYGDLLGKGKQQVTPLNKHSGMLIEGLCDTIINCKIYSSSYGHLFFVQGGRDIYFENCYAEAKVRSTDEMLAETSGVAFDIDFKSVYKNYDGEAVITPGYTKSLSECGFRNYGSGGPDKHKTGAVTLVNCSAKNTRIGFAFTRMDEPMTIENCQAEGCEVGYYLSGVDVKGSRGDAAYGPLMNILSLNTTVPCNIELELIPTSTQSKIHCLAAIAGEGHKIKLSKFNDLARTSELPILFGMVGPPANNGFSPMRPGAASNIELENSTGMPIVLNSHSSDCRVTSNGEVSDLGAGNVML